MINYKFKNLLFILPVVILVGVFLVIITVKNITPTASVNTPNVVINNHIIFVEIADTTEKQWLGLSRRESLGENSGMLFIFPAQQARTFVMREMNFALDIIWISNGSIVKIDKNLPPEGKNYTKRYDSIYPVDSVLEVNAGFTDKNNIKAGDKAYINL